MRKIGTMKCCATVGLSDKSLSIDHAAQHVYRQGVDVGLTTGEYRMVSRREGDAEQRAHHDQPRAAQVRDNRSQLRPDPELLGVRLRVEAGLTTLITT